MNINEIINQKVSEVIASDKLVENINQKVEEHINDVINETLKDIFGWNGEGRKQIKEIIKRKVVLPTSDEISLPAYNKIVAEMVQQKLSGIMNNSLIERVNSELENFIKPQGNVVKFSEIIEKFKGYAREETDTDDLDFCEGSAYVECTILADGERYGSRWLAFDLEEDQDEYRCKYRFGLAVDRDKPHIYGLTIKNVDYKKDLVLGSLNRFESYLVNLYLTETKIDIDIDLDNIDCDVEIEPEY